MNIRLKQRLLAAIVILALIVIFVPMLFRKHTAGTITSLTVFPEAPAQPDVSKMTPTASGVPSQAQQNLATSTPQSSTTQPSTVTEQQTSPSQTSAVMPTETPQGLTAEPSAVTQQPTSPSQTSAAMPTETPQGLTEKPSTVTEQEINKTNTSAQPENVIQTQSTSSSAAKAINSAQQKVLHASHHHTLKTNKILSVKPINVPVSNSIQNFALSQTELNNIARHVQVRNANANSNNVLPEINENQKAQLKIAKSFNRAWVLQLGSFANKKNAENLVKKLRKKGITTFSYPVRNNHIINYRVYVGPMVEKSQAKAMKVKVKKEMKIAGFVTKFDATRLH